MKPGQMKRINSVIAAATMFLFWMGCDGKGLVDETYPGEPLAVVNGSLSIDAPEGGQKISIAVAWINGSDRFGDDYTPNFVGDEESEVACDGTPAPYQTETYRSMGMDVWALQSAAYEATSLVRFQLPIVDLPPESARIDLSSLYMGEGWMSLGVLIAYLDRNGDGKFAPATPESPGDELLAASFKWNDEMEYEGLVVYLNGTIAEDEYAQEVYGALSQGFNVQVGEWRAENEEEQFTTDLGQTVRLFTPDAAVTYEMINLQCSEIEHVLGFNQFESVDDQGTLMGCERTQAAIDSSDGTILPGPISIRWSSAAADPDNPCVVHEYTGFVCFPGPDLPTDWQGPCVDDTAESGDATDVTSDGDASGTSDATVEG